MLNAIYRSPSALLIYTGALFGLTFPLGKLASQAGVPPIVWAMVISLGAVIFIAPDLWKRRDFKFPRGRVLQYVLVSGLMSFALVNVMIFALIPKLGAGQVVEFLVGFSNKGDNDFVNLNCIEQTNQVEYYVFIARLMNNE